MDKLASVVAVAALGVAGWAAWSLDGTRKELAAVRGEVDLLAPLASLEGRIAALETSAKAAAPPPALSDAPRPAEADPALLASAPRVVPASGSFAPGTAGPSATSAPATRVEELEKRLAALEEKEKAGGGRFLPPGLARLSSGGAFYTTPDDAAKDLELDPAQKSDLDRIVADAHRELEDLRRLPDEDGKSFEQIQREMFGGGRDGGMRLDLGKMLAWNGKTIPGRNETFGAADRRIRDDAKARLRQTLRPDQQVKLDRATVDPLFGRGGPGMVFTSVGVETTATPPK